MSNARIARREIDEKYNKLNQNGFNFGAAKGAPSDLDHGGWVRIYEQGQIYWHPATGAHEVHGGILQAYLERGGPDRNPKTGNRDLKFPTSDEHVTRDGRFPVSTFEEGTMYWLSGRGGVAIYGKIHEMYRQLGGGKGRLGYPVTDPLQVGRLEVAYFERGCLWMNPDSGGNVRVFYFEDIPQLGRPAMLNKSDSSTFTFESVIRSTVSSEHRQRNTDKDRVAKQKRISKVNTNFPLPPLDDEGPIDEDDLPGDGEIPDWINEALLQEVRHTGLRLWSDRLVLRKTGYEKGDPILLQVEPGSTKHSSWNHIQRATVTLNLTVDDPRMLADRQLYDICLRRPEGDLFRILPHSLYVRDDWKDFQFIQATDFHVSERIDGFRSKLEMARSRVGPQELHNFNDNIRNLIRYANRCHQAGDLDFIMATGDLVDYIFEENHNRAGGGNFEFFEEILLGRDRSADPDSPDPEELRVPIFTILGNHDYVLNSYALYFDIDIPAWSDKTVRKYSNFNLTEDDTKVLQDGEKPTFSADAAQRMAESVDVVNDYYTKYINSKLSYVVKLGQHRLMMLETGPNKDIIDDKTDALQHFFGLSNENELTFTHGTPNTKGIRSQDLRLLKRAVDEAGDDGQVVVGMHAPPLNPWVDEYPYYFRETERPGIESDQLDWLVDAYFSRQILIEPEDNRFNADDVGSEELEFSLYADWPRKGTPYFKEGEIEDLLDLGIARDNVREFLRLCISEDLDKGLSTNRPVDLVLFGHVHRNVEFRLEWEGGGFRFFQDFYTENPKTYYPSYDYFRYWENFIKYAGDLRPIHVEVKDGARPGKSVIEVDDEPARGYAPSRELAIPPYTDPLDTTNNAKAWWEHHRPLMVQTACLGPIDRNQRRLPRGEPTRPPIAFQGFRLLNVKSGNINGIKTIRLADEEFRTTLHERLEDKPRKHHVVRARRGGQSTKSSKSNDATKEELPPDRPRPKRRDHRTGRKKHSRRRSGTRKRDGTRDRRSRRSSDNTPKRRDHRS